MRFFRVAIGVMIALGGLIGLVEVLGRRAEPQNFALLTTDAAGKACQTPCLLGIHPGDADLNQVMHTLETHPLTRDLARHKLVNGVTYVGAGFLVGLYGTARAPLQIVTVQFEPTLEFRPTDQPSRLKNASLGEVLSTLGTPSRIALSRDGGGLLTRADYDALHISIFFRRTDYPRLTAEDKMLYLIMYLGQPIAVKGYAWRGLTAVRRYIEQG